MKRIVSMMVIFTLLLGGMTHVQAQTSKAAEKAEKKQERKEKKEEKMKKVERIKQNNKIKNKKVERLWSKDRKNARRCAFARAVVQYISNQCAKER